MNILEWATLIHRNAWITALVLVVAAPAGAQAPALMTDRTRSVLDGSDRERISAQFKTELKRITKMSEMP
jgi:hypothetical protein